MRSTARISAAGWRSVGRTGRDRALLELGPGRAAARHRLRFRRPDPGPGRADGLQRHGARRGSSGDCLCPVGGGARAFPAAPPSCPGLRRMLPFADGTFDSSSVRGRDQSPARPPGHLREWARLLRPGGRLLFTDALVRTGRSASPRSTSGPGWASTCSCPRRERSGHRRRWTGLAAGGRPVRRRGRHRGPLARRTRTSSARARSRRGGRWCHKRQRFLAVTAELARSGRLSRFLYLAERPLPDLAG